MPPEELRQMQRDIREIKTWMENKKRQQITLPLDDASRNVLGGVQDDGAGSTSLTQTYTDSNMDTHSGPKAYIGTRLVLIGGVRYEVPYIATS